MGTGFISGLKSLSDGKWSELDAKLKSNLSDPLSVKFTQAWVDMVRESGPPNWANMQWYDAMEAFTAGQAGMIVDADFFAASYEDPSKSKVAGKVGYAVLPPVTAGGASFTGHWLWGLGIPKTSEKKDAAWYFVQWMTNKANTSQIGTKTGGAPRLSAYSDPVYTASLNPAYVATVNEAMKTSRTPGWPSKKGAKVSGKTSRGPTGHQTSPLSSSSSLRGAGTARLRPGRHVLPQQFDLATGGRDFAGQDVDQGGLARTVGANDRVNAEIGRAHV